LGSLYRQTKQYVKSIDFYTKAIEIDPLFIQAYNGLGNVYADINEYEKAIDIFNRAQKIDPKYAALYFNRARVFQFIDEYEKAISDYKKRIELSKGRDDYYASLAKSKINDLLKILKNPEYSDISEIVEKVRKLLLYTEECVTHYTGFSVAKILILENSKFRLSEGTYLNDTSEGRELFKFLPPILTMHVDGDTIAQPFASKPFIGSFVSETKHDDLTLWRMYGKEDKVEARGCAITIERDKFLENIKDSLVTDYKNNTEKIDEEFSFFKVAYRKRDEKDYFIIPGASKKDEKDLNSLMSDLLIKVEVFVKEADDKSKKNLIGLLNSIAFLFKSAEYQYEHELRLIVKGTGINKIVDESFTPPKVYIELIGINPLIKKVTFGPKVERVDEWASAFYYKLDQRGFNPDIFISHLPFK
jgi:tetratricopeptide (TPR) repeat protein